MCDEPLTRAAEIYRPFGPVESRRLRNYVKRVEKLVGLSFFERKSESVTINFSEEDGLAQMHDIDEEALMAVAGLFRMLYNDNEPTSFSHAMKLLSSHVDATDPQLHSAAVKALRELRRAKGELLKQSGIQMVVARPRLDGTFEEETLTTEQIIDLWLHGELLHAENENSDALDAWPVKGLPLFEFCGAVRRLARLFWIGRNVVAEILKHDELLDAAA